MVHTPLVPSGYWSPCAPLVWDQGFPTPRHEKAVSSTSLAEAVYAWPCESILRGRAGSPHSRLYQGIWGPQKITLLSVFI
ncbi:unnamed protein product [Schistosoma margrebowiei]|uniref:Uncharacterized protein n=1 Tax=Schistosoma margrebowiei TaxID=48269 RepID=A0A3P7YDI3_9TREM|nr:unnamed protein product [Schistosoma margrebowiei]